MITVNIRIKNAVVNTTIFYLDVPFYKGIIFKVKDSCVDKIVVTNKLGLR